MKRLVVALCAAALVVTRPLACLAPGDPIVAPLVAAAIVVRAVVPRATIL